MKVQRFDMKKFDYELDQKEGVIYYNLDHGIVDIVGVGVYVPFFDDWIDVPADELSILQLNALTNDVADFVANNPKIKEYNPEDYI